jgi:[acyl-carrier-protein] S-malonyltransferase
MEETLRGVALGPPVVPLVANVSATATRDPRRIERGLVEQVTAMVRWRESVLFFKDTDIGQIVEIGAGRVLTGLVKRIDPEISALSVGSPSEVEALMKEL